jgi:hypothetical protein
MPSACSRLCPHCGSVKAIRSVVGEGELVCCSLVDCYCGAWPLTNGGMRNRIMRASQPSEWLVQPHIANVIAAIVHSCWQLNTLPL